MLTFKLLWWREIVDLLHAIVATPFIANVS